MKLLYILAISLTAFILVVGGCNQQQYTDRYKSEKYQAPANETIRYTETCINGVVYYYLHYRDATAYSSSVAPAFGPDSKVLVCPKE